MTLVLWDRIYLEEGKEALFEERRGRTKSPDGVRKGRPKKLYKEIENEYLKKLDALIRSR